MKKNNAHLYLTLGSIFIVLSILFTVMQLSIVNNKYTFSYKGYEFLCTGGANYDTGDTDFSDGNMQINVNGDYINMIIMNNVDAFSLSTYGITDAYDMSGGINCVTNFNSNNVEKIEIPVSGQLMVQPTRRVMDSTANIIGLQKKVESVNNNEQSTGVTDITIEKLIGNDRWIIQDNIKSNEISTPNTLSFTSSVHVWQGNARSEFAILDIIVTCEDGYMYINNNCLIETGNNNTNPGDTPEQKDNTLLYIIISSGGIIGLGVVGYYTYKK